MNKKTKGLGPVMSVASPKTVSKYKDQLYKEITSVGTGKGSTKRAAEKTGIPTSSVRAAMKANYQREVSNDAKATAFTRVPSQVVSAFKKASTMSYKGSR